MLLKVYAGLTPDMTVFDLGCGTGRVAASLTKVLSPISQYFGVDIIEREIRWLSGEYSKRHPNFHFHYIDVYSPTFNPAGKKMTDEINFDFLAGQKVDIVFLVSVFTHLYPQQIRHYLKLARSILKPDGRLFASMFINDAFAKERQRQAELSKQKLTSRTF
jgi:SAM-dependent methyltransferase